jgi:lipopolysaccharide transport system ATP-binding protein
MSFVLRATNLGKRFTVRESHAMSADGHGNVLSSNLASREFWAVKNLNFEIQPGEIVHLIGANGAGKTTLLRMIARTIAPSEGKIEIRGKVGAMLGADAAFAVELTGRENCFLTGAVLGLKREAIAKRMDDIVEFADLSEFIDSPVRYYSSGMYLRLALAIALQLQTELLIVDEALSACDTEFQARVRSMLVSEALQGRTIIVVDHSDGWSATTFAKTLHLTRSTMRVI